MLRNVHVGTAALGCLVERSSTPPTTRKHYKTPVIFAQALSFPANC
jgi:hypothetical protein